MPTARRSLAPLRFPAPGPADRPKEKGGSKPALLRLVLSRLFGGLGRIPLLDDLEQLGRRHRQRLRPDAVTRQNDRENLMASAPAQDQGYFLVPKVID